MSNTIGWTNSVPLSGLLESNRTRDALQSIEITLDHSLGVIEENLDSIPTRATDQQRFNQRENTGTDLVSCAIIALELKHEIRSFQANFDGQITLKNLEFRYPNRLEVPVLRNFELTIEPCTNSNRCG